MTDYAQVVYDYIHTLGNVGDEVRTEIWPYLSKKFDLTPAEATRARRLAMRELTNGGLIERLNIRGPYGTFLGDSAQRRRNDAVSVVSRIEAVSDD